MTKIYSKIMHALGRHKREYVAFVDENDNSYVGLRCKKCKIIDEIIYVNNDTSKKLQAVGEIVSQMGMSIKDIELGEKNMVKIKPVIEDNETRAIKVEINTNIAPEPIENKFYDIPVVRLNGKNKNRCNIC